MENTTLKTAIVAAATLIGIGIIGAVTMEIMGRPSEVLWSNLVLLIPVLTTLVYMNSANVKKTDEVKGAVNGTLDDKLKAQTDLIMQRIQELHPSEEGSNEQSEPQQFQVGGGIVK